MSPRKRNALVMGACALALYLLHLGWFLLFGPPEWFQGVGERAPEMTRVRLGSAFDRYLEEFARPGSPGLSAQGAATPAGVAGQIVREDRVPGAGPALLQTRDEEGQRLYTRRGDGEPWREWPLPPELRLSEARWMRAGDSFQVLLALSRPWWPYGRHYGRFWLSLLKPELRPEKGLYLLDPADGTTRYLFPGWAPKPSPDRSAVVFLRTERRGYHSLHRWRVGEGEPVTVVSLWEADPGSGSSFDWTWSADSNVLYVGGTSLGFKGSPERERHTVRLLYDVEEDRLFDLRGQVFNFESGRSQKPGRTQDWGSTN